jgi:hypothetical protein
VAGALEVAARTGDDAAYRDLLGPLVRELQRVADDIGA